MCGIIGFNWEDKELIKKLTKSLEHRGPDGKGYFTDKGISLGHTRLSIIDLSKNGKQPMSDSGICITFNGEIYNYKEQKEILEKKGHKFKSETDTEVILKLYKEYGLNFLEHLRGMFAFAIWDNNKKYLILARDPLGIKPLYYFLDKEKFIFSSEIKSFKYIKEIKLEPDKDSVIKLLAYRYTPDNQTAFKNIKKILPGEFLILKDKQITNRKYYNQKEDIKYNNLKEGIKKIDEVINDSVKKHMIADVEVGSFLSGGIDSSIVSAIAQKYIKNLKTFSIGFDNFSELKYSRKVAEHINSDHNEVIVDYNKAIKTIPKLVWQNDEPLIDFAAIPFYILSEFTRKKVKVVLTGIGGDEMFGGYEHYKRMVRILKFSKHVPKTAVRILSKIPNRKSKRASELLSLSNLNEIYMDTYFVYKKNELINEFKVDDKLLISPLEKNKPENIYSNLNKILYLDQKILEGEYFNPTIDKTTMAHALEARIPYLDKEVVNISFQLNPKFKLNGNKEKIILKMLGKKILPKEIITRKKQGYGVPYYSWIKSGIGDQIISTMENPLISKIIPKELIKKTILNTKKSETHAMRAWMLYSIEEWYKTFII